MNVGMTAQRWLIFGLAGLAIVLLLAVPVFAQDTPPYSDDCDPSVTAGWFRYEVQAGDTLSGIALRSRVRLRELAGANCLSNMSRIRVGQILLVPVQLMARTQTQLKVQAESGQANREQMQTCQLKMDCSPDRNQTADKTREQLQLHRCEQDCDQVPDQERQQDRDRIHQHGG